MKKTVSRPLLVICIGLTAGMIVNALYLQSGAKPLAAIGESSAVDAGTAAVAAADGSRPAKGKSTGALKANEAGAAALAEEPSNNVAATVAALVLGPVAGEATFAKNFSDQQLLLAVRRELVSLGYTPGGDGKLAGLETRAEILAFEADRGLPLSATPSESLLQALVLGTAGEQAESASKANSLVAKRIITAVEQRLADFGYAAEAVDGIANAATTAAIKAFEADRSLSVTGRISADLVRAIAIEVTRRSKSS